MSLIGLILKMENTIYWISIVSEAAICSDGGDLSCRNSI